MILDSPTDLIRIKLDAAAAIQPNWFAGWVDVAPPPTPKFAPGADAGAMNGTSYVTLFGSPASSEQRQAKDFSIFNRNSAQVVVTFERYDGSTGRVFAKVTLEIGWWVTWEQGVGWVVFNDAGVVQGGGGGTGGLAYLVVREADLSPSVNATILEFDQSTGLTVSDMGSGRAKVASAAGGGNPRRVPWMLGG